MPARVLLIGWDAADWAVAGPLLEQGKLPTLQACLAQGMGGRMATLDPPYSPALWTSVATGKRPWQHNILNFAEPRPNGSGLQPITTAHLRARTLWDILSSKGMKSAVVGWWPSYPAPEIKGCVASDLFFADAPPEQGTTFPPEMAEAWQEDILRPGEITAEILAPFFPNGLPGNPANDPIVQQAVHILSKAASVQAVATRLLEEDTYHLCAVYFEAIDRFKHLGMNYMAPRRPGVAEEAFHAYQYLVEGAYRFMDMCLERLLALAGQDCKLMLLSDHGFRIGDARIDLPEVPLAAALDHTPYGLAVASGPGIPAGKPLYGPSLLDVAPTILHWLGLPAGADMEGRVLAETMPRVDVVQPIATWEPKEAAPRQAMALSLDHHLADLGYLMPRSEGEEALRWLEAENALSRARSLHEAGKLAEALETLEHGYHVWPDARFRYRILALYLHLGHVKEAHILLQEKGNPVLDTYYRGLYLLQTMQIAAGWEELEKIPQDADPALFIQLARMAVVRKNAVRAMQFLQRVPLTARGPEHHEASALVAKLNGQPEEALEQVFKALEFTYYKPSLHALMGQIALQLGEVSAALQAWKVAVAQAPHRADYRARLAEVYRGMGMDREAEALTSGEAPVVVVSGLPRSGTSLLMHMLEAGGLPVVTDGLRTADGFNPGGYREDERAKNLSGNQDWILESRGKALKILVPEIGKIRPDVPLRVLFMQRPITEVVSSQERMRGIDPAITHRSFPLELALALEQERTKALDFLRSRALTEVLEIAYEALLENPPAVTQKIIRFLHLPLQADAMARVPKKTHS